MCIQSDGEHYLISAAFALTPIQRAGPDFSSRSNQIMLFDGPVASALKIILKIILKIALNLRPSTLAGSHLISREQLVVFCFYLPHNLPTVQRLMRSIRL